MTARHIDSEPVRGIQEFTAYAADLEPDNRIEQLLNDALELLRSASSASQHIIFDASTIVPALKNLISGTAFEGAILVEVEERIHGSVSQPGEKVTMLETIGQYPISGRSNGAYNVWFAFAGGNWYLKYNRVSDQGNLRGRE